MGLLLRSEGRVPSPYLTTAEAAVHLRHYGTPVVRALKQRGLLGVAGRLNIQNDATRRALRAECQWIEDA